MSTFGVIGARSMFYRPQWWGLYFESLQENSTVRMMKSGSPPNVSLLYSFNGLDWIPFSDNGDTIITVPLGYRVFFRASGINNAFASAGDSNYHYFTGTGYFKIGGNIMSLLDGELQRSSFGSDFTANHIFTRVFCLNSIIVDASSLILPQDTKPRCFSALFRNCSSLKTAPKLPASYIAELCCLSMFQDCASLENVPPLLSTNLGNSCYYAMFWGCKKLQSIEVRFTSFSPSSATSYWFNNSAASGIFKCPAALGTNDTIERGVSRCPSNWTVVNI